MIFKDGHYVDSGLPLEEREKLLAQAEEEDKKFKSWSDVPPTYEDQEN